jgi:hypothetical protein
MSHLFLRNVHARRISETRSNAEARRSEHVDMAQVALTLYNASIIVEHHREAKE